MNQVAITIEVPNSESSLSEGTTESLNYAHLTPCHRSSVAQYNEELQLEFDFDAIRESYSPQKDRDLRSWVKGGSKVMVNDNLCGGDWIVCPTTGEGMTISF